MLVVKDLTLGITKTFVRVDSGYAAAYAFLKAAIDKGHAIGGDIADIEYVMGPLT